MLESDEFPRPGSGVLTTPFRILIVLRRRPKGSERLTCVRSLAGGEGGGMGRLRC